MAPAPAAEPDRPPLAGRTVVIDPGHQLGNYRFPQQINAQVSAGGFRKACNTTGTATDSGFPEATFTWKVSKLVAHRLRELGAEVVLTRATNSAKRWGPCVDVRGRAGNKQHADLKLSIHADGSFSGDAHGFHVLVPPDRRPWTHDIWRESRRYGRETRTALRAAGVPLATYLAGGDGLDVRADLGTLNLSDVPVAMVELGNMRDPRDVRRMTSTRGRSVYAKALVTAIRRHLRRRPFATD